MCLTMIYPTKPWSESVELSSKDVPCVQDKDKEEITEIIIDISSACVTSLFNKSWLCCYPRAFSIVYDNGSKFKLFFECQCEYFQLKHKPTTIKSPQANTILETVHQVVADVMRTSSLDVQKTCTPNTIDNFISNVGWAIRSTHHSIFGTLPGTQYLVKICSLTYHILLTGQTQGNLDNNKQIEVPLSRIKIGLTLTTELGLQQSP